MGPLFALIAILVGAAVPSRALNDFLTDNPRLMITADESKMENLDEAAKDKVGKAKELIRGYHRDWQRRFGRLQRHLHITLVPVERQISVSGGRAEGVWSWKSFTSEEGTLVTGISGVLYVNINSTIISQEALVAHESSHAFLLAYQPKLLERGNDLVMYNEGLAELFSVQYESRPWRAWDDLVHAHQVGDPFNLAELSAYGRRIFNVLRGKPQTPHDLGFFYLFVVQDGKVNLDSDLKECGNKHITDKIAEWLKANPNRVNLPMIHD